MWTVNQKKTNPVKTLKDLIQLKPFNDSQQSGKFTFGILMKSKSSSKDRNKRW